MSRSQKRVYKYISFAFTCLNGIAGILGIYYAIIGDIFWPLKMIIIGAGFDFLDGYFAKRSQQYSLYGAYMDSIADAITYVCVPSFFLIFSEQNSPSDPQWMDGFILLVSLFYMICGSYRLIRFVRNSPKTYFEGLPTSIAALVVGSLIVLIMTTPSELSFLFNNRIIIVLIIIAISLLMITHLKYPSHISYSSFFKFLRGIGYLIIGSFFILSNFWTVLCVFSFFCIYIIFGPVYMNKICLHLNFELNES
ncbi:MAG: CDP-alcohol phosphatidyltransferase family protein [Candidatus Heimdallarchaeota archaeon]|nr:MAG: CDP-alcohol phosphatidyltransferase family protein [Candidatus Heimdallarchaeota archaeon]